MCLDHKGTLRQQE